jgi:hypothetical protein
MKTFHQLTSGGSFGDFGYVLTSICLLIFLLTVFLYQRIPSFPGMRRFTNALNNKSDFSRADDIDDLLVTCFSLLEDSYRELIHFQLLLPFVFYEGDDCDHIAIDNEVLLLEFIRFLFLDGYFESDLTDMDAAAKA